MASYWTHGSKFLCIRTDVEGKVNPSYERVAQTPEVAPGDDPQYSDIGDWDARAEQIVRTMNAHDDLVAALSAAIGYMRNARIDLETGATKATAIRTIDGGIKRAEAALAKAKGEAS